MRSARQTQGYRTDTVWDTCVSERGGMRTLTLLLALLAILLTGCGSDEPAAASAWTATGTRRPARPTPDRRARTRRAASASGALAPGTYTTLSFSPAITYTVPAGWTNGEDLPGNFLLQLEDDIRYIGIYRDANAPYKCEQHPDPDVSQTVSDYTRWLRHHPLLH